jgi:type II secretory pathway pseudopilin PulG
VAAIIGIVVGLSIPNFTRSIDNARLKAASQQLAAAYQNARLRATQTNTPYEVLLSAPGVTRPQVCLDLDGDGICGAGDPATVFPAQVSLNNTGVPPGLGLAELGFTPTAVDPTQGVGWNGYGIPCQKSSSAAPCATVTGWVQYLQLRRSGGDVLYGAVAVSPTGRVKIWTYTPSGNGNGNWF